VNRVVWRIATDTRDYEAHDLAGMGAKTTGGRWNNVGVAMVYAAATRALSCLETLVHLNAGGLPLNRYLVEIEIPDDVWTAARAETPATLPVGWNAQPAGRASVTVGTDWVASGSSALLRVPSSIAEEEANILINPLHPDSARIKARKIREWLYDPRLKPSAK
jgi:RES domain-containing protein